MRRPRDRAHSATATEDITDMAENARTLLHRLARAHGVQTRYTGQDGSEQSVGDETLIRVLAALGVGVDARGVAGLTTALEDAELAPWRRTLPPTVAVRRGHRATVPVHVAPGADITAVVRLEDGGERGLSATTPLGQPRLVDGQERVRLDLEVPDDLPLGWHRIEVRSGRGSVHTATLICAPDRLTTAAPFLARRGWGVAAQGYSVTSEGSWGMGDIADAAAVAEHAAAHGADFVLLHPLHAIEPGPHPTDSPYSPVSRRFLSALLIRVTGIPEFAALPAHEQAELRAAGARAQAALLEGGRVDRSAAAAALWPALRRVWQVPRTPEREADYAAFRRGQGPGLDDFALWSVLRLEAQAADSAAPHPQDPEQAPGGPEAETVRAERADDIDFHRWVQWVADGQLAAAQHRARAAGMRLGVMLDLAVGATRGSADAWMLGDVLVPDMSVGAPPEVFNQLGQDWSQHPWHPVRLAETGYAAFRDMVRTVIAHAGGLRMDHVLGLFRLWWIPEGMGAPDGAYVEYDHEVLLAVLTLEAERAGVVVIGEDLGTFEPWVQRRLAEAGILGTSILWFEQQDGVPTPPERYRRLCLAAVNTHDLPPTAGYLEGVHLDLRERLGLYTVDVAQERRRSAAEVEAFLTAARERGLLETTGPDGAETREDQVVGLHRLLAQAPSALHCVSLVDAVGERRIQNQPGTRQEQYPNWTVPLGDPEGRTLTVEDLPRTPSVARLYDAVEAELREAVPVGVVVSLHTSPLAQPGRGDAGGMNVYVRQSARALARRGLRMLLLTRAEEPVDGARVTELPAEDGAPAVTVVELAAGPAAPVAKEELAGHRGAFTAAARAWLSSDAVPGGALLGDDGGARARSRRVAFVHGHYWLSAATAQALAVDLAAPLLQTMHTTGAVKVVEDEGHAEPRERLEAEAALVHAADLLMVNSPAEARELQGAFGVDRRRLRVLPPGVDLQVFTPEGPAAWPGPDAQGDADGPEASPLRVLFAGRVQRHKGPHLLVEALAELRARAGGGDPGVRVHVNGEASGPETLDVIALAGRRGVSDLVSASAPVPPARLAEQMRGADAVALPSASETYGLVAVEAQACGTPVLAHRVGGLVHAVQHGVSGVLVHPNTAKAWADALERVRGDRPAWVAMSPAAVRHARGHSWDDWAESLLTSLGELPRG